MGRVGVGKQKWGKYQQGNGRKGRLISSQQVKSCAVASPDWGVGVGEQQIPMQTQRLVQPIKKRDLRVSLVPEADMANISQTEDRAASKWDIRQG